MMAKVNDLNHNSSPCLRQTASRSYDQPLVLVSGGGGAARSAHSWIHHCASSRIIVSVYCIVIVNRRLQMNSAATETRAARLTV